VRLQLQLPLVQMVVPQARLAGDRRGRSARRFQEADHFALEFFGERLPLRHQTPPGAYCPLFEVSTKVGLAQAASFPAISTKNGIDSAVGIRQS